MILYSFELLMSAFVIPLCPFRRFKQNLNPRSVDLFTSSSAEALAALLGFCVGLHTLRYSPTLLVHLTNSGSIGCKPGVYSAQVRKIDRTLKMVLLSRLPQLQQFAFRYIVLYRIQLQFVVYLPIVLWLGIPA